MAENILQATGPASPLRRAMKNLEEAIMAESGGDRETRQSKRVTTIEGEEEIV